MAGTVAPFPRHQLFDNNGNPAVGYKLFTYEAGSSTKLATYTDAGLSAANTNPIVLDGAGRATIFLLPTRSYKFVLALPTDTDPPASPIWTVDDVDSVPSSVVSDLDVLGQVGENVSAKDVLYLSDGSGGKTTGRWYKAKADAFFSSFDAGALGIATEAITSGNTGTIRLEGKIDAMAGAAGTVYYVSASTAGAITSTAPANRCIVGVSDNNLALIRGTQATYKDGTVASSSAPGLINLVRNGDMDLWPNGVAAAPQFWAVSTATVARTGINESDTTTLGSGYYAAKITTGGAADWFKQDIFTALDILMDLDLRGRYFTVTAKAKAGNGVARLRVYDGTTTTYSDFTTGSGAVETLRLRAQFGASANVLTIGVEVIAGNSAYFGGVACFFSALMPSTLWPAESDHRTKTYLFVDDGVFQNSGVALTALKSFALPPMQENDAWSLRFAGGLANNGNTKTVTIKIAGTSMAVFSSTAAIADNTFYADLEFLPNTNAHDYMGRVSYDALSGGVPTIIHLRNTVAVTSTNYGNQVTIYGQSSAASNDITLTLVSVKMFKY